MSENRVPPRQRYQWIVASASRTRTIVPTTSERSCIERHPLYRPTSRWLGRSGVARLATTYPTLRSSAFRSASLGQRRPGPLSLLFLCCDVPSIQPTPDLLGTS